MVFVVEILYFKVHVGNLLLEVYRPVRPGEGLSLKFVALKVRW